MTAKEEKSATVSSSLEVIGQIKREISQLIHKAEIVRRLAQLDKKRRINGTNVDSDSSEGGVSQGNKSVNESSLHPQNNNSESLVDPIEEMMGIYVTNEQQSEREIVELELNSDSPFVLEEALEELNESIQLSMVNMKDKLSDFLSSTDPMSAEKDLLQLLDQLNMLKVAVAPIQGIQLELGDFVEMIRGILGRSSDEPGFFQKILESAVQQPDHSPVQTLQREEINR